MKYVVTLNGKKYDVEVNESEAVITSVSNAAPAAPVAPVAAPAPAASTAPGTPAAVVGTAVSGTQITSPMPGTILKLNVAVGQSVKAGDVVLILEAMKMENEIVAPCDGTVMQILVSKGSTVDTDQILAVVSNSGSAVPVAPVAPVAPAAAPAPAASTAPAAPTVVGTAVSGTQITSPMPGTILKLNVAEGQAVKAGDVVLILEAMKMENEIVAPCDGTIKQILVTKGSTVDTDQILAVL